MSQDWTDGEDGDDSLTGPDGSFDRERVVAIASAVLERWERDDHLDAVRGRVRNLFVAFALLATATWLFEPRGLSGFVFQTWWLASLPLAGLTGTVYVTLRNPNRVREIWWDDGALVTLGLIVVAILAKAATSGPAARVAWQLLFAEDSPTGVDYGYDAAADGIDGARVAEIRGYVNWAILGSVALVALDVVGRVLSRGGLDAVLDLLAGTDAGGGGGGVPSVPALPGVPTDPLSVLALLVGAVVVGAVVGVVVALRREL
ncbi:hypothetical protein [Halorubellus sp. PRR65]|uniref:hypothetical protein n=1 Tax=Halorubellus sp. PRR65 TaxID=3098148 RepID=UPI002B262F3F|nr:hypothetical protein [Halorubellus sp. PRR65]